MKRKMILAGGSGFLGRLLADYFAGIGCDVIILTRSPRPAARYPEVPWDARTLGAWARHLESAAALINLTGRTVNCRYTAAHRAEMIDSRVQSTRVLGQAIGRCTNPPSVWLNASTATIYKHNFGPAWDEQGQIGGTPEAKDRFSVEVACAWERELDQAITPQTRKVALRSAMVLGHDANSVLPTLLRLVRFGLGGPMGSGLQYVSWIHQDDFCRALEWIIEQNMTGAINVAAPAPLTNSEMMRILRNICGRKVGLPAPLWMLEIGAFLLRTETELIIKSRRVIPKRLLDSGFRFQHATFSEAVQDLLKIRPRTDDDCQTVS